MYRLSAKTSNQKLLELRFDMRAARHDPDRNVRPSLPVGLLLIVDIEYRFLLPITYPGMLPDSLAQYQSTMYLTLGTSLWHQDGASTYFARAQIVNRLLEII